MALKDDIKNIKNSASSEEQFLESIIKSEIFIKKYKKPLIVIVFAVIVFIILNTILGYVKESKFNSANEAYSELILNPKNENAKDILRSKNENLFSLYEFRQALDNKDMNKINELSNNGKIDPILKDIISFTANKDSGEIMESYKTLLDGYELLKAGKIKEANSEFIKIPPDSELASIVKNLRHYNGIKNEKN
ncbi:hypothetical protein CBLAS_0317 [Campylobacter blaseri]|uniref:Tetratricopeptide repeat-like domain-containing protein n=1 Tax=Campylobacter blaseri TaxID=2042961 RepID=A0A2P8R1D6_9BACT|nr:hypothetical protein [Campylobacter blaseri]PSM52317.1 hypothetical protein CQ405_04495 [Campylobacter blaseri]PSM54083.1 hypothetical protein CRN67_04495 [Campylobacter blaseri]QKF85525.1 hypothetical protein CBLAS_0317 [Campylobacter blaseri]